MIIIIRCKYADLSNWQKAALQSELWTILLMCVIHPFKLLFSPIQFDNSNPDCKIRIAHRTIGPTETLYCCNEMMVYVINVRQPHCKMLFMKNMCLSLCIHFAFDIKCLPFMANQLIQTNYLLFVNTSTTSEPSKHLIFSGGFRLEMDSVPKFGYLTMIWEVKNSSNNQRTIIIE